MNLYALVFGESVLNDAVSFMINVISFNVATLLHVVAIYILSSKHTNIIYTMHDWPLIKILIHFPFLSNYQIIWA